LHENSEQALKIKVQNSSIELHLAKTVEFESKNERLKKELVDKEKENQAYKAEIERLRNLKWYDKLFGQK